MASSSQVRLQSERVAVQLGPRSYEIEVGTEIQDGLPEFVKTALSRTWSGRSSRLALVVTDENVAPKAPAITNALQEAGLRGDTLVLPAGEGTKSLQAASLAYERMVSLRADRHTLVVALGGGVIGDLAGFVAATFARGVPLLMIPTSLLAQVDSSVGGKVGINLPSAKNLVGSFHQPIGVWIDTRFLETLPQREYRSGLAEVVKYGVILDEPFFLSLEQEAQAIADADPAQVRRIVARSCELKAQVVTADEREETGLRAVLNFGHTIAHAIEAVSGYGKFLHGEAVAIGMVAECCLAERLGWVESKVTTRLENLLKAFGLPTTPPTGQVEAMIAAMTLDKKNRDGRIRFVLPRKLGHVELTDAPNQGDLRDLLS